MLSLDSAGLLFVFTSGVFSLFSPCGIPMLPGYISYYMGSNVSLEKALSSGIICTTGLIIVFSIIGVIVSFLGSIIYPYIQLFEVVVGLTMIILGISMFIEKKLFFFSLPVKAPKQKGYLGFFLYGAVYGMATLGCSAPIFFSILFYAINVGGIVQGVITFIIYAFGMGAPMILITLIIAKTKRLLLEKILRMTPWLQKISGLMLIVVGIYLISYYFTVLNTI